MAGNLLVDTSVAIDFMRGDAAAARVISIADTVFAPSIVLGELVHGAERSNRRDENLARVEMFATKVAIVPVDEGTAHHYGEIKTQLIRKGRPLPENDIWIAAVARQHDLTVVTRDSHFGEVDQIALISW